MRMIDSMWRVLVVVLAALMVAFTGEAAEPPAEDPVFGIWVDPTGALVYRERDAKADLAGLRQRGPVKGQTAFSYVSLTRAIDDLKAAEESGKVASDDVRYLSGLTQIRFVMVYPQTKEIVLVGPADQIDKSNALQPRGKQTGRAVVQLDDVIVQLRRTFKGDGGRAFGCSIDPPDHSVQKAKDVMKEVGSRDRKRLADELAEAMSPQNVRLFGTPEDSRIAFICVAADYQLKRYTLGLDPVPVSGMSHAIDNTRPAGNGFWFEADYQPMLVSEDGLAFALRGPRLKLLAGAVPFDTAGATATAQAWAKRFTEKVDLLAAANPLFADLQNLADVALLAQLMKQDKLHEKAGYDMTWVLDDSKYSPRKLPVPRQTHALVNFAGGSVAAGGVSLNVRDAAQQRETDKAGEVKPIYEARSK